MATVKSFRELLVWQKAKEMAVITIKILEKVNRPYSSILSTQMIRSALSVSSNIAEGFEREGNKEFANFLAIAKGSNGEFQTQLAIALECGYITQQEYEELAALTHQTGLMIKSLMKYLSGSTFKGQKYKPNAQEPASAYSISILSVDELNQLTLPE